VGEAMESEMADAPAAIPAPAAEPLAAVAEEGEGEGAEAVGSTLTMERVAAAKKLIENHYRSQMKNIQERKERYPPPPIPIPAWPLGPGANSSCRARSRALPARSRGLSWGGGRGSSSRSWNLGARAAQFGCRFSCGCLWNAGRWVLVLVVACWPWFQSFSCSLI